jgi:uncharacterized protein
LLHAGSPCETSMSAVERSLFSKTPRDPLWCFPKWWITSMLSNPCIGICQIDEGFKLCRGCARSRTEIAAWTQLALELIERVWAELPVPSRNPVNVPFPPAHVFYFVRTGSNQFTVVIRLRSS